MTNKPVNERMADPITLDEYFAGKEDSRRIFDALHSVVDALGNFTHHLELYSPTDLDEGVRSWLREAWSAAE